MSEEERKKGFLPLFNGKNLDNWRVVGNDVWRVENGTLVCRGSGRSWIRPVKKYRNFILRLEYKLDKNCNSGIFIRTSEEGRPAFAGMEIQLIDDYGKPPGKRSTGAIYAAIAPSKNVNNPAGQWNRIQITADGPSIKVLLNGAESVDDEPGTPLKDRLTEGYIGLQNHGEPPAAYFRNIRIKEL